MALKCTGEALIRPYFVGLRGPNGQYLADDGRPEDPASAAGDGGVFERRVGDHADGVRR